MPRGKYACKACGKRVLKKDHCPERFNNYAHVHSSFEGINYFGDDFGLIHRKCCKEHNTEVKMPDGSTYVRPLNVSAWTAMNQVMKPVKMCDKCKLVEPYVNYQTCRSGTEGKKLGDKLSKKGTPMFSARTGKPVGAVKKDEMGKVKEPVSLAARMGHDMIETSSRAPIPIVSGPGEFKENPIRRLIGYEIECGAHYDGNSINELAKKYGAGLCHDGGDFEMNPPPANGDKLVALVKDLSEKLRLYGAVATERDGLHTHIDCRDLSWEEIRRVLVVYGKIEAALYSIIDPRRFTNNSSRGGFSKPVGGPALVSMMSNPLTAKDDIIAFVYGSKEQMKAHGGHGKTFSGTDRYLGLNLLSWFIRGTIEFRMHHGTTRAEKMLYWGMLLAGMIDVAANNGKELNGQWVSVKDWPTGKEGMLACAPTAACRDWVVKRWDYFAKGRKNKNQPALITVADESAKNTTAEDEASD